MREAHTKPVYLFPPVRRLDISQTSGGLGEHCPSSAVGHVLCAPLGRVAQPRLFVKYRGNPEGAAHRGRLLLVTFLGKTRKVTSCRATPDGVGFKLENRRASPILRQAQDERSQMFMLRQAKHERSLDYSTNEITEQ